MSDLDATPVADPAPGASPGPTPGEADLAAVPDAPADERVAHILADLRARVPEIQGCLVASVDGLLIAEDVGRLPGPQTAALTSTLAALATQAVVMTDRGALLDATIRGTHGHLMVFAVGSNAVLAVVADPEISSAWLHVQTRSVVEELTAIADRFPRFFTG